MFGKLKSAATAGALAASLASATSDAAQAGGRIVGLVDGKSIVTVDATTRKVMSTVNIRGAGTLLGIDVRPADGMLYAVTSDGYLMTVDPTSGQATMRSKLSQAWKKSAATTFDFNPVADRLRLMNSEGVSLRINVDDGMVTVDGSHKYKDMDQNAGRTPRIVAGAYSNSFKGTKATTLYNIDAANGMLVTQAPPNDGVLNTVGSLGIPVNGPVAFDIVASQADRNVGWLAANGSLYSVDLKTGKATLAGKIGGLAGMLTDIAWID